MNIPLRITKWGKSVDYLVSQQSAQAFSTVLMWHLELEHKGTTVELEDDLTTVELNGVTHLKISQTSMEVFYTVFAQSWNHTKMLPKS